VTGPAVTGPAVTGPAVTGPASAPHPAPPGTVPDPAPAGQPAVPQGSGPADAVAAGPADLGPGGGGAVDAGGLVGRTAQERLRFRLSLGWRYGAAVRSVARLMAERPGLRIATGDGDEDAMTELAAVRVFAESDQRDLIRAMRAGLGPVDRPYAAC